MNEIPHPAQTLSVIGHDHARTQLLEAYGSGRMHHAWLLIGEEGVGKATLAYQVAHTILSKGESRINRINANNPASRLIMAQTHPDLFVLSRPVDEKTGRQKDSIPVDDASKLGPFLGMTASQGCGRVAIIDEAHRLNRNGQNAILKMIEEPPTGTTMILTATTVGSLLPTIKSRCRMLKLDSLTDQQIEVICARMSVDLPSGEERSLLLKAARGSLGRALTLLETEILPLYKESLDILRAMPSIDLLRVHKLADAVSRKEESESYLVLTNLIVDAMREAVRCAALGIRDPAGLAQLLVPQGRLDKGLHIWESTAKTFETAETANLDRKLALINAFSYVSQSTV
jgi:DNA polymerase-3 subunit delta'